MKIRYLARLAKLKIAVLAILVSGLSGCIVSSQNQVVSNGSVRPTKGPSNAPLAIQAAAKAKLAAKPKPTTAQVSGILTDVEPPKIASPTKFADAENAPENPAESPQMTSMRQQMTRRYGCCGR